MLGHKETIAYTPWPTYDESKLVDDEIEIVVQINGKIRDRILVPADCDKEELEQRAMASEKVQKQLAGKTIRKVIVVPKRLVNIVAN